SHQQTPENLQQKQAPFLGVLFGAITHKATAFKKMQFQLARLKPTDFVFLCEKFAGCCYLPRIFWFRRRGLSVHHRYAERSRYHDKHRSNRNVTHELRLQKRRPRCPFTRAQGLAQSACGRESAPQRSLICGATTAVVARMRAVLFPRQLSTCSPGRSRSLRADPRS